jgi:putative FmdB family regulatory protein
MPTYEYRCPEGHEFEQFVLKISAAKSELVCPTCGLVAPRRMSAGGGLLFKGSGFYITDYGKDGKKVQPTSAAAATSSSADAKGGEGKGASSESKGASGEPRGSSGESKSTKESAATGSASTSQGSTSAAKPEKPAPASAPKSGPAK